MALPTDNPNVTALNFQAMNAASVISTGASLACIIIRSFQATPLKGEDHAVNSKAILYWRLADQGIYQIRYLEYRNCSRLSMETLAIQYGLPYGLLMWGFVLLLLEISARFYCLTFYFPRFYFFAIAFIIFPALYNGKPNLLAIVVLLVGCFSSIPLFTWVLATNSANNDGANSQTRRQKGSRVRMRFGPVRQVIQPIYRRPVRRSSWTNWIFPKGLLGFLVYGQRDCSSSGACFRVLLHPSDS